MLRRTGEPLDDLLADWHASRRALTTIEHQDAFDRIFSRAGRRLASSPALPRPVRMDLILFLALFDLDVDLAHLCGEF